MKLRLLISLSLLLLLWQKACAQLAPADDFFNSGAQLYISNNIPAALERVETGLKIYPDDVKLKKLEQLLKQQQQSQSQQKQQNQSKQQPSQNQQKNSQSRNSNGQQDQSARKKEEPKNQPPPPSAKPNTGEKKDHPNEEKQPAKPGQMTPEEAKRLMDSQKGNEQVLQMRPPNKPPDSDRPIKDW